MMAVVHASVAAPASLGLQDNEDVSFDRFKNVIQSDQTTIPELFAVLRLWEPMVQEKIGAVAYHLIQKGAGVNDRDAVTDLTMLHFVCKSGAAGVGNDRGAADVARDLLRKGADPNVASKWTSMTPLHYAAFFGSADVIETLATEAKDRLDLNPQSTEFEGGTPLHLAAMAGAQEAVARLLKYGADPLVVDSCDRTPLDCAKLVSGSPENDISDEVWQQITKMLTQKIKQIKAKGYHTPAKSKLPRGQTGSSSKFTTPSKARSSLIPTPSHGNFGGETASVGDRVVTSGGHHGTVKYRGPVSFDKRGDWLGIQLDTPNGKNSGSVAGVNYFRCKPDHGIFVRPKSCAVTSRGADPLATPSRGGTVRVRSTASTPKTVSATPRSSTSSRTVASTPVSTSRRQISTPGSAYRRQAATPGKSGFGVGSKVFVSGKLCTVHYIGDIGVAPGTFVGVELPDPSGKNDGSLEGERYFTVRPDHGLFVKPERCTWRGFKVNTLL